MHRYSTCFFPLRQTRSNDTPIAIAYLASRTWFIIPSSKERNQGSFEKWQILELGKEIGKISLEHFVVLESKDVLKNTKGWGHVKVTQEPT